MSNAVHALENYLQQLQANGQTHIAVDEQARLILREFYRRAQSGNTSPAAAQTPTTSPTPPAAVKKTTATALQISGNSKAEKIDSLRRQAADWAPAKALDSLRKTMVFSTGNPEARIMLVGEAPGFDEERLSEPFVGKAGQKLNGILAAMGIRREETYISNIVKYRPAMPNQTTNNRKPTPQEMHAWMPFIEAEISIVKPDVIIALGGTAAQALLNTDDSVGRMRGKFHTYQGIPLRVTYHPSYILHNDSTTEKRKLWEDMLDVMRQLNLPISDKQQSYFLPNP